MKKLYTEEKTAKILHVTKGTLAQWRHYQKGPAYIKLGRGVFYDPKDVTDYINSKKVTPRYAS